MKITKKIVIILVILLLTFLLLVGSIIFLEAKADSYIAKYKAQLFDEIRKSTGYGLYAENISIKPQLKPYLPVKINHFMLYSPDDEKLFKSTEIFFKIKLLPLLKKKINIYEIELNRPVFEFDSKKQQQDFEFELNPVEYNGFKIEYNIRNLRLNRYKFNIKNGGNKYFLEGEKVNISNSSQKNSIKLNTQGALNEGEKELLKYNVELETPLNILSRKDKKADLGIKKYIKADIKSEKIELSTLRDVYGVLFRLASIKTPLMEYRINGEGSFDFSVESDFKTLHSKGIAEVKDAQIKHKSIPFEIRKINSKINFENNNIVIEKASALINNNPVNLAGTVNEHFESDIKFEAKDLELKNLIPLISKEMEVKQNVNSGFADISARLLSKSAKDYDINGNVIVKKLNLGDKDSSIVSDNITTDFKLNPKMFLADITSEKIGLKLKKQNIDLALKKFKAVFDDKDLKISPSKLVYGNCVLDLSGIISDIKDKNRNFDIEINGEVSASELEKELSKYFKFQSASKGKLPIYAKINGVQNKAHISAKVSADKNNYLSLLVIKELLNKPSLLNIMAKLNEGGLKIENISLMNIENIRGLKDFKLTTEKVKKIVSMSGGVKFKDKTTTAQELKFQIPESMTFSTGLFDGAEVSVKGDLNINGDVNNPKLKGFVILNKLNLLKHNISIQNTELNFTDEIIKVVIPNLVLSDSKFNISAQVLPKFGNKLYVKSANVASSNLNLKTLTEMFKDIPSSDIFPGFEVPLVVESAKATINRFEYDYIRLKDVTSDFTLKDNIIKLSQVHSDGFDGTIKGNIDFNFLMQILNLDITGSGLNTNKLLQALSDIPCDLTGRTELEAKFQIKGATKEQQIKSLRGSAKFITNEGQLGVLGQFERYLQAQNLLNLGIDRVQKEDFVRALKTHNTSYFRRAEGKISFENGYAYLDSFKTQGKIMSLLIKGKYNLLNDLADLDIFGKISDEIFKEDIVIMPFENDEIPDVLSPNAKNPRGFKVCIDGTVDNIRAINSFQWLDTVSFEQQESLTTETEQKQTEKSSEEKAGNYEKYPSFLNEI